MTKEDAVKKISDFFVKNQEDFFKCGLTFFVIAADFDSNSTCSFAGGPINDLSTAIAYRMHVTPEIKTAVSSAVLITDGIDKDDKDELQG